MSPSAGKNQALYGLVSRLGQTADLVGESSFYSDLLATLAAHLRADLSMLMRYSRRSAPEYLIHDQLRPEHMELYLRGLYRVDPIYRLCRGEGGRGVKDLAEVSTPEERSGDYFNIFLQMTGMADDLAMLFPVDDEACLGLVYERGFPFQKREIAQMRALFPLLDSLHRLHQKRADAPLRPAAKRAGKINDGARSQIEPGLPPIDYKVAVDGFLHAQLTPRERDIVRLILVGYPNAKIAERLDLSVNTIKNHKKRMYLKLDITTERELFLNFVNFLFKGA